MYFKKDELKLLWPFYMERGVYSIFMFFYAFYVPYLLKINFSMFEVGIALALLSFSTFIFEIPTGAVADLYSRKNSVLISYFLVFLISLFVFFFPFKIVIFIAFFLKGIANTFLSGADEAWVIDILKHNNRKDLIGEYYTKAYSFANFSMFLSGIVGSFIVKAYGLNIMWLFLSIGMLLSFLTYLVPKCYQKHKSKSLEKDIENKLAKFWSHTKSSIKYAHNHHAIKLLIIITLFYSTSMNFVGDHMWVKHLLNNGIAEYNIGILFSISCLIGVFTPYIAKKVSSWFKADNYYLAVILGLKFLVAFVVLFLTGLNFGIFLYFMSYLFIDMYFPVKTPYFQSFIPNKMRSTITSFNQQIKSIPYFIFYPVAGLIADKFGAHYVISFGSVITLICVVLYLKIKKK